MRCRRSALCAARLRCSATASELPKARWRKLPAIRRALTHTWEDSDYPMLRLSDVTAGYVEGIDILRDVCLEAKEGAITGIIGANGAGKSTMMKTVFGFLHPRKGSIVFRDREIHT